MMHRAKRPTQGRAVIRRFRLLELLRLPAGGFHRSGVAAPRLGALDQPLDSLPTGRRSVLPSGRPRP